MPRSNVKQDGPCLIKSKHMPALQATVYLLRLGVSTCATSKCDVLILTNHHVRAGVRVDKIGRNCAEEQIGGLVLIMAPGLMGVSAGAVNVIGQLVRALPISGQSANRCTRNADQCTDGARQTNEHMD